MTEGRQVNVTDIAQKLLAELEATSLVLKGQKDGVALLHDRIMEQLEKGKEALSGQQDTESSGEKEASQSEADAGK